MKLPVEHNIQVYQGEFITMTIGCDTVVNAEDVFACIRRYSWDDEIIERFVITNSTSELLEGEKSKLNLTLYTNSIDSGTYYWDLFIWAGNRPVKCLVKGKIIIKQGISNRGK